MAPPTIAIVGSVDQSRAEQLGLKDAAAAARAAEEIGRELATQGCRMLVYSSDPAFVEPTVVRGYVTAGKPAPNSIEVRYPAQTKQPSYPEQQTFADCFKFQPSRGRDWEVSFYHSLHDADGVLIIGGGQSTFISGLVAIGMRLPIVALAGFGGAAEKVWESIPTSEQWVTQTEASFMAHQNWSQQSAATCVKALLEQRKRSLESRERLRAAQASERKRATVRAVVAVTLFVLSFLVWPLSWIYMPLNKDLFLYPLLGASLLAGASGASVRSILDNIQGESFARNQPAAVKTLMGVVAGGMVGALFLLGQLVTIPESADPKIAALHARGLVPFSILLGFIGGLTLDAVFRKIRATDVVHTEGLSQQSSGTGS